jgi:hypothetical protein
MQAPKPPTPRLFVRPRVKEIEVPGRLTQAQLVLASLIARPQAPGESAPKRGR